MAEHSIFDTVQTVDCHYGAPGKAAAFLVVEQGHAAFVDNNTVHAVPRLLGALAERRLSPAQVDYLIITHVHLDHAGGTAAMLKRCPNAMVLAHPKAARHLIEPERLIAGAMAVYGEEAFKRLYGVIEPVPADRIRVMGDGEELAWGGRTLRFFYTLGHASHHFCIYDNVTRGVFTGDSFGLGPVDESTGESAFLMCTSAPPDFDVAEARLTVQRILDTGAERLYLPHFGIHRNPARSARMLLGALDRLAAIQSAASDVPTAELASFCALRVMAATEEHLRWCGLQDLSAAMEWLGDDPRINAMGLAYAIQQQRRRMST